ncbi:hypothetical protein ACQPYH_28770 [Kribbella sp. CA-245084]|uniref:hypothetical protein n=1 Tax=Kribbella sp. CA-245084 TaxID=3239940 RepID=UPI003D8DB427
MTHYHHEVPRRHWLIRYYRAQLRISLRVLAALRIVPRPIAAAAYGWLRRTQIPKRGSAVKSRSKIVIPLLVGLGVVALTLTLVLRSQDPDRRSSTPNTSAGGTVVPSEDPVVLDAWRPPTTTDPQEFAIAYARAIWTYDTTRHSYVDWQNAVSVFAVPTGAAPQVAKSLLPTWAEWNELEQRKARASIGGITAEITPDLAAMVNRGQAPKGWHAYVVHGKQTAVLDTQTLFLDRKAAVAVICTPTCRFWSATAQVSP